MDEEREYNWFFIVASWDWTADAEALAKFGKIYRYLNTYNVNKLEGLPADDPLRAIDFASLKAFNLIGQRKFVIIARTASHDVLQKIASDITLETAIRVEVIPATYVHDFARINAERIIVDRAMGKKKLGSKKV